MIVNALILCYDDFGQGGIVQMKLATRINSYLRVEGYDLEKTFADFKKANKNLRT